MRTIYWVRFAYRDESDVQTTHEVEFGTSQELDGALAELHHYDPEDFMLAASGERDVMYHHHLKVPREWGMFRKAAIDYKNKPRVRGAKDAAMPPVDVLPAGWPPEEQVMDEGALSRLADDMYRKLDVRAVRALILLGSAVVGVGVVYALVRCLG